MTTVRILIEAVRNRTGREPAGYVATAFDEVGKLGTAIRTRADDAVERCKELARLKVTDAVFVVAGLGDAGR